MGLRAKWAAVIFIAAYFFLRIAELSSGHTHVDDIGPLTLMLRWRELGGLGALWHELRIWTYAPGPYLFSFPLLNLVRSPQAVLFAGRAVSLAGWALGLALFWGLLNSLRRLNAPLWPRALSAGLFFWALASWRGTIESSQAYNYAWTVAVAALLLSYLVGRLATVSIEFRFWRGLRDGLLLGLGMAFSYQAMFIAAAVFGALAVQRWRGIDRKAWKEEAAAAFGFGICIWFADHFHIRHLQMRPGHPPWADGFVDKQAGLAQALLSLAHGAWSAAQNVLAIAPWGLWTAVITGLALAAALLGLRRGAEQSGPGVKEVKGGLLLFGGALLAIWSLGAWTQKFPFGSTRHTFILQLPLLVILGLGLQALPKRLLQAGFIALALVWLANFPGLLAHTRNQVDLGRIEALLDEHPEAWAIDPTGAATWDHLLLWNARPDLRARLSIADMGVLLVGPQAPQALILASHSGPLVPLARERLAQAGYAVESLASIAPQGAWELAGSLNSGNGFDLYYAQKAPKKP